jgi:hypothetical protein
VTALADLLAPADRRRLLGHLAEADERELDRLGGLAALMRQVPGQLPPPVPPALHPPRHHRGGPLTASPATGPCVRCQQPCPRYPDGRPRLCDECDRIADAVIAEARGITAERTTSS